MGIELSLPKLKIEENICAIILCAGEGKRIRDFVQKIPKPLIELKNQPLLMHIISNLISKNTGSIIIITGHLGDEIKKYLKSIRRSNLTLYEKVKIIDSRENYKKGPLYSFLSIKDERAILKKNKIFMIIPGDTYFDPNIFTEIFNAISYNLNNLKSTSLIFYQKIKGIKLKSELDSKKQITCVIVAKEKSRAIIRAIQQRELCDIDDTEEITQIVPIFIFNYKLINKIIKTEKQVSVTTLREIINYLIQQKKYFFYGIPIDPHLRFIDIDTKSDFLRFIQKKEDNRDSDQSECN